NWPNRPPPVGMAKKRRVPLKKVQPFRVQKIPKITGWKPVPRSEEDTASGGPVWAARDCFDLDAGAARERRDLHRGAGRIGRLEMLAVDAIDHFEVGQVDQINRGLYD